MFTPDKIYNFHNVHICAHANPHAIRETRHQTTFSINVWAAIFGDGLIGPIPLPEQLTGPTYREILERLTRGILSDVLDDVPLELPVGMLFMHYGAPPHFSHTARQYLNTISLGIGSGVTGRSVAPSFLGSQSSQFLPLGPH